ncbi:MAG: exodeoxyribonuclease VII small subunit [Kangiellaceae bacterium]|jgi:exodeoxyribonuclease VII small subunit|nr:exodeoxyribonuclease VII small subunit [Kangiellaceae bacterium]
MSSKSNKSSFEEQLAQLEAIVEQMEQGDMPLDDALKQFEQGVKLTANCQNLLDQAKQRIQVLTEEKLQSFDGTAAEE